MRKRLIPSGGGGSSTVEEGWLALESIAEAEVTSEDPKYPLESALGISPGRGWQAAGPGAQTIRLLFDQPRPVRRIHLEFREEQGERTQEFVLRWSDGSQTWREMVRQQYNFSPAATREVEDYTVELNDVTALEMQIIPDLARREARASLQRLQIA